MDCGRWRGSLLVGRVALRAEGKFIVRLIFWVRRGNVFPRAALDRRVSLKDVMIKLSLRSRKVMRQVHYNNARSIKNDGAAVQLARMDDGLKKHIVAKS